MFRLTNNSNDVLDLNTGHKIAIGGHVDVSDGVKAVLDADPHFAGLLRRRAVSVGVAVPVPAEAAQLSRVEIALALIGAGIDIEEDMSTEDLRATWARNGSPVPDKVHVERLAKLPKAQMQILLREMCIDPADTKAAMYEQLVEVLEVAI